MKKLQRSLALVPLLLVQSVQAADASEEQRLAVLKTPEPIEYRMENSWVGGALLVGVPWLINKGRNGSLSSTLTTELIQAKPNEYLRGEVESILARSGIGTIEPPKVSISPVKPWDVRYAAINTDGKPFLHVYVERIGVQSRGSSRTYQPFLHVVYCLVIPPNNKDCTYSERSYYGEGYTEEDYLVYPADLADQWADSDDVFRRVKSVEASLYKGLSKIADGVAKDVIKYMAEAGSTK